MPSPRTRCSSGDYYVLGEGFTAGFGGGGGGFLVTLYDSPPRVDRGVAVVPEGPLGFAEPFFAISRFSHLHVSSQLTSGVGLFE